MRPGKTARAMLVLAAFLVLFVVVDRLSGPGRADRGTAGGTSADRTTTASTRAPTSATGTTATRPPTTGEPTTTTATTAPPKRVTVQVLNGAFVAGLANRVAARVRAAGYEVVATNPALGNYPVSRVYYTAGHRADAEAFRERFPAFRVVAPAPSNLSRQVALHAVIGENYPGT